MAANEIFKTVMKGYKKDDVISYISNLSDQIERLKDDVDQKDVMINRLQSDIKDLEHKNETPDETVLEPIRQQIQQQVEQQLKAEYDAKLQQQLQEIKSKEQNEVERKAQEYEDCKDALADLMIQARHTADDIISKARADADALRIKSETEYAQLIANYEVLKQNVAGVHAEVEQELDQISEHMDRFEKEIELIRSDMLTTVSSASAEQEDLVLEDLPEEQE